MYYLGYEKMNSDFFLETDVCCLSSFFLYDSSSKVVSRTHIYYRISLKEFKNTIIEEKELYYYE